MSTIVKENELKDKREVLLFYTNRIFHICEVINDFNEIEMRVLQLIESSKRVGIEKELKTVWKVIKKDKDLQEKKKDLKKKKGN